MRDVARVAGVSLGSVSHVLNGRSGVSPALAQRVLSAAAALDYRHKERPRRADGRPLRRVAFVIGDEGAIAARPYYAAVLGGAGDACDACGLALTYRPVGAAPGGSDVRRLAAAEADALLLVGYLPPAFVAQVAALGAPFVVVSHEPPGVACDRVLFDDAGGGRLVGERLLELGHRSLAVVHGPLEHPVVRRRVEGLRTAAGAAGGARVYTREVPPRGQNPEGGYRATLDLLDGAGHEATAIFCTSDRIAFGALRALRDRRRRVPHDVSVAGFNDHEAAAHVDPPLTTVRADTQRLGQLAVQRLVERARDAAGPPVTVTLGVTLVERESVAAPRPGTGPLSGSC
jgi:DNA-binding LacI/PurR family transcriptional regulator